MNLWMKNKKRTTGTSQLRWSNFYITTLEVLSIVFNGVSKSSALHLSNINISLFIRVPYTTGERWMRLNFWVVYL